MSITLTRVKYPFYYPTQVNPKKTGTTKGGYLEGSILLPECWNPGKYLRLKLSSVPHEELYWNEEPDVDIKLEQIPIFSGQQSEHIHPCLLHLVYMKGGRRNNKDEPEPSFDNWIKELSIQGCIVKDVATDKQIATVERCVNGKGWMIGLGKGGNNLNINLLLPKTKAKHLGSGIVEEEEMKCVIRKMVTHKNDSNASLTATKTRLLNEYFHENNSINLNRLKIQIEFLWDGISILAKSPEIQSQGHKKTASIKFETPNILKCCTNGGRTVVMESKCSLPKDIKPKFLAYRKSNGSWSKDKERQNMVNQPDTNSTVFSKINNSIKFEAPKQDMNIIQPACAVMLMAVWNVDGEEVFTNEFEFKYVKHPWPSGGPCVFCELNIDGKEEDEKQDDAEVPLNKKENTSPIFDTFLCNDDLNIPIDTLIDFPDESSNSSAYSSSTDGFTSISMDSEKVKDNDFQALRGWRAQRRKSSNESSNSSSSDSFIILNSVKSSPSSNQSTCPSQILPSVVDLETFTGQTNVYQFDSDITQAMEVIEADNDFRIVNMIPADSTVDISNAEIVIPKSHEQTNTAKVSCYQQQQQHDSHFDYLNSLQLFGNLNLFSLGEILFGRDLNYHDPDKGGLFTKTFVNMVAQEKDISFVDVLSFPYFDRISGSVKQRVFADYFPARKKPPSLLVLHRFGGATTDTIQQYLAEVPGEDYKNRYLSWGLTNFLSKGLITNYVVLHNMSSSLIIRLGDPSQYSPQSVGGYNHVSVTALVQTNQDQELHFEAFTKLLNIIKTDLDEVGFAPPSLLACHQEVRGSCGEGWIANIDQLRKYSGMRKPSYLDL